MVCTSPNSFLGFVFWCVLCALRYFHLGLALVAMRVQIVAAAAYKCQKSKQLNIKQEPGRGYPVFAKFTIVVLVGLMLRHVLVF